MGSPSAAPQPREISARDVRDLALAVVEGAVAAEALAKELRRSPDRSRHFAEIAERLRAVLGRGSIRVALAEDGATTTLALAGMRPASHAAVGLPGSPGSIVGPIPSMPTPPPPPAIAPPTPPSPPSPSVDAIARTVATLVHAEDNAARLARIEKMVAASIERVESTVNQVVNQAVTQAVVRANLGERMVVSTASEAVAVAQKLLERVAARGPVVVRIE
jgi:hypothetical protein